MLDYTKLLGALKKTSNTLFIDNTQELVRARHIWETACVTSLFAQQIQASTLDWLVPAWEGDLAHVQHITPMSDAYHLIAVDGSQIYPDRHQGTLCSLVNIGLVEFCYRGKHKGFRAHAEPYVFTELPDECSEPAEYINQKRHELELQAGLARAGECVRERNDEPIVLFCDGSLIFWYTQDGDKNSKPNIFLERSLALLSLSYEQKIPMASYISLPHNRELVGLVRLALCGTDGVEQAKRTAEILFDTHIADFYLKPYMATRWFKNQSPVTQHYSVELHPYFAYIHVGAEIARIEAPAWVAHHAELSSLVLRIALDQAIKGNGYPVCLAEAHEQAVIKAPDRDFFYQTLATIARSQGVPFGFSRKNINKQVMGI